MERQPAEVVMGANLNNPLLQLLVLGYFMVKECPRQQKECI